MHATDVDPADVSLKNLDYDEGRTMFLRRRTPMRLQLNLHGRLSGCTSRQTMTITMVSDSTEAELSGAIRQLVLPGTGMRLRR